MAAITAGAIAAAGALGGSYMASKGAKDAARAQQRGTDAAIAEQRRQFDAFMEINAPRRAVEGNALNMLARLTGVPGADGEPAGPIDYSAFYNSPDYQFALQQGEQSAMRGASAMGNLRSGNTLAALTQYGQGLATQNFGNYINRLSALANGGATAQAGNAMLQQGQNIGGLYQEGANARASGIAGQANAWGSGLSQLGQIGGYALSQYGNSKIRPQAATQAGNMYSPNGYSPYGGTKNYLYGGGYNA